MNRSLRRGMAVVLALALFTAACGGSEPTASVVDEPTAEAVATTAPITAPTEAAEVEPTVAPDPTAEPDPTAAPAAEADPTAAPTSAPEASPEPAQAANETQPVAVATSCEETAAQFVTRGSANPNLADPEVNASCAGGVLTVMSNAIPDYTYIRTSPGDPNPQDLTYTMPATPVAAAEYTAVPYIGPVAVALNGVPIYGPTEGQGGDVLSLGALSECGSHNGPGGFHLHLFSTSTTTDCIYTPDEVAQAPQLFGYAFDGYPIYTGNDHYTSSWVLADESLFAVDTWVAHAYVEGSGDLDECNGLTDANGNYAYYTTDTFPYVIGCFAGQVDLQAPGGDRPAPPGDDEAGEGEGPAGGGPAPAGEAGGEGGAGPEGPGGPGGGGADLTEAAAALGISVEELEVALGEPPPDFAAAAAALGITVEELEAVLPAPPGR